MIARETNLSETTFVLPATRAEATYRARIFTPGAELPFAGHPTLGTAAVVAMEGMAKGGSMVQETLSGLTPVSLEFGADGTVEMAVFRAPAARVVSTPDPERVARALGVGFAAVSPQGLRPAVIEAGVRQIVVPVDSPETLAALAPETGLLKELTREEGVVGAYPFALLPKVGTTHARARLFAPAVGIPEDPATGSAAAPLGLYLSTHGLLPEGANSFWYEQGVEMGRPSQLRVEVADGAFWVGGAVQLVARGVFYLD